MFIIAGIVGVIVGVLLTMAIVTGIRRRKADDDEPVQLEGNFKLEIALDDRSCGPPRRHRRLHRRHARPARRRRRQQPRRHGDHGLRPAVVVGLRVRPRPRRRRRSGDHHRQRPRHPGGRRHDAQHRVARRHPLVLDPRRSTAPATPCRVASTASSSRPTSPACTSASARSTAASRTPTCTRGPWRSPRASSPRGSTSSRSDQPMLDEGDPGYEGQQIFLGRCTSCHQIDGLEVERRAARRRRATPPSCPGTPRTSPT